MMDDPTNDLNDAANATARLEAAVDTLEARIAALEERLRATAGFDEAMRNMARDREALAEALAAARGELDEKATRIAEGMADAAPFAAFLIGDPPDTPPEASPEASPDVSRDQN
jgi:septal ring factor EnvC (AmiA/AmiB activator)